MAGGIRPTTCVPSASVCNSSSHSHSCLVLLCRLRSLPTTPPAATGASEQGTVPSEVGQSDEDPPHGTCGVGGDSTGSQAELPDHVIVALLQREHLLMLAGIHLLRLTMSSASEQLVCLKKHEETVSMVKNGNTKHDVVQHSTAQLVKHSAA